MLAPTHSVFGVFATLIILAVFGVSLSLHWTVIFFAILGSVVPDIDHPKSAIGKMFSIISVPMERKFGHRTATHSLLGWAIGTIIMGVIVILLRLLISYFISDTTLQITSPGLPIRWVAAFSIGYFSHVILDMFNKRGSQLLWPDSTRDVIPGNAKFRTESGSKVELVIFAVLLCLMIVALPISKYGIGSSLRWLLATPASAVEEFKELKIHAFVEFEGSFKNDKQDVSGMAEIIDVENNRLLVLYEGTIYTLSDELSADIIARKVRVKYGDAPIEVTHKVFKNKPRKVVLEQIPEGALISGKILLPKDLEVVFPASKQANSSYIPITQKDNVLTLRYASAHDIKKLRLDHQFDLEQRKDQVALDSYRVDKERIETELKQIQDSQAGLTPLGQQILMTPEERAKQEQAVKELKNQLSEVQLKIDELTMRMESRKMVFSGDVRIRR